MYQFRGGHIPPSTPSVGRGTLPSSIPHTSVNIFSSGGKYVNIRDTTYIPLFVPPSSIYIPSNVFFMENPPLTLVGPQEGIIPLVIWIPCHLVSLCIEATCLNPICMGVSSTPNG